MIRTYKLIQSQQLELHNAPEGGSLVAEEVTEEEEVAEGEDAMEAEALEIMRIPPEAKHYI